MILEEKDLRFDFSNIQDGIVFDQMNPNLPNYHGLGESHRVDFIIENEDDIYFIEIKDPSSPRARRESIEKFLEKIEDGSLYDSLVRKFIDSFVYRWSEGKLDKSVHYICLVTLDSAQVLIMSDEVDKRLPPFGKSSNRWIRSLKSFQIVNLEMWHETFTDWPVSRLSDST